MRLACALRFFKGRAEGGSPVEERRGRVNGLETEGGAGIGGLGLGFIDAGDKCGKDAFVGGIGRGKGVGAEEERRERFRTG